MKNTIHMLALRFFLIRTKEDDSRKRVYYDFMAKPVKLLNIGVFLKNAHCRNMLLDNYPQMTLIDKSLSKKSKELLKNF